jgi:RES domain
VTATPAIPTARLNGIWVRHVPVFGPAPDPFHRGSDADGRWQRASDAGGFYLADEEDTAWAEWYRYLGRAGLRPDEAVPRYLLSYRLDLEVADLRNTDTLAEWGLTPPDPNDAWSAFQDVGATLVAAGHRAIVSKSAARPANDVLCIFRPPGVAHPPGVEFEPPPRRHDVAPVVPRGMRT